MWRGNNQRSGIPVPTGGAGTQQRIKRLPVPVIQQQKPKVVTTSWDEFDPNDLQNVQEARATWRERERAIQRKSVGSGPTLSKTTEADAMQKQKWRVSEVPTASSVYTPESSPGTTYGFDPESKPAPLFAYRDKPASPPPAEESPVSSYEGIASSYDGISLPSDDSTSTLKPSNFQEKAARSGVTALQSPVQNQNSPVQRPAVQTEWRGASGDTNLMTPIADMTPVSAPASRQSSLLSKKNVSPVDEHEETTIVERPIEEETSTVDEPEAIEKEEEVVKAPVDETELPTPTANPKTENLYRFAEPASNNQSRFSWTTNATSQVPTTPKQAQLAEPFQTPEQKQDPRFRSHFSWTTVPTDISPAQLPRDTPERKLPRRNPPSPTNIEESPMSMATISVTERHRPVTYHESPPRIHVVKRKPTPSMMSRYTTGQPPLPFLHIPTPTSHRSMSQSPPDTSKNLPPTPATLESVDTMSTLEAELETLKLRRRNLDKMVKVLQNVTTGHQDPLVRTLAKRRDDKKRLTELEEELSEVRRMEHEIGLKLHRCWKRREQEGSATAIWVRRVTR